MNKLIATSLMIMGIGVLGLTACSKKSQDAVDTTKVERSFQTAPEAEQGQAEKIVAAVKSRDYAGALASLQTLAGQAALTPDQKSSVQDLIAQVQEQLTAVAGQAAQQANQAAQEAAQAVKGAADKAAEGASKALGDFQKSLKK
ncbi:MAG: hypothetical protein FJ387_12085 [Verrucomicrobia bacterium]|nr:hypothetical protein [Verrucomicrobiota bacterium]